MIRRLFGRAGAAAGLAAVFAAASAAGLIVHIDSAPARGVAARAVNGALRAGVRGEVVVRRVERLGLDGFEIAAVEARAPGGERALLATGLRARIDVPALARGLLGDGEIGAAVSRIEIDHADVDVGLGASGAPRIAEAFSPSRGGGAGRPVRIAIDRIELGEGWIHGAPAEGREVDATVAGVIGRAVIGPALTRIEIEDARVEERRLLDGAGLGAGEAAAIEARVAGHVEIGGGAEGREIAGTMSIEGSAAGIGIAGRVDLDGARARGVLGLEAPGAAIDVAFEAEPGEGRAWASARAPSLVAAPWLPAGMGGSAAARADVAWRGDDVDGRIEARAVGLRVGEALSAPQARLRAEVRGRLSGAAPRIDVSLRAEDVVAGGRALDRVAVDAAGSSRALQARAEISRAALRIEGRAEIDAMGAEARGIRIEIDRGRDHAEGRVARASMRGGGVAIEELVIEGRGLGKIEGALSLRGDEIDADLHGERLDVGRLAAIAGVPGVGGLARVDLELRGPRGARAGRLEIDLAHGRFPGVAQRVSAHLDARSRGASVEGAGRLRLLPGRDPRGAVPPGCEGAAAEVLLRRGEATLAGDPLEARAWRSLAGSIELSAGAADLGCLTGQRAHGSLRGRGAARVHLDAPAGPPDSPAPVVLTLHLGDAEIEAGRLRAELAGDPARPLRATAIGDATTLDGDLRIVSGRLDLPGRAISLEPSLVRFGAKDPASPHVEATATWPAQGGARGALGYAGALLPVAGDRIGIGWGARRDGHGLSSLLLGGAQVVLTPIRSASILVDVLRITGFIISPLEVFCRSLAPPRERLFLGAPIDRSRLPPARRRRR